MAKRRLVTVLVVVLFSVVAIFGTAVAQDKKGKPKFEWEAQDGISHLSPGLTVQLLYSYYEKDMGEDIHPEYSSEIEWRRIRPKLSGNLFSDKLGFYLHASTAPGSIELLDMYLDYSFHKQARLRVGQYKIPFTQYRQNSYSNIMLPEWPVTVRYFGAERQMGIMLHNGVNSSQTFEYRVGLFNGMNARKSNGVGTARVTGEVVANPSDLIEPGPQDEFHPETVAYLGYNYGGIDNSVGTDWKKTGPRLALGASGTYDSNPVPYRDFSLRAAPELLFKVYGFSIGGVYYVGWYEEDGEADQRAVSMTGAMGKAGYLIGRWVEIVARYSWVGINEDFREDALDRAQAFIASAPEDELEEVTAQYKKAGTIKTESELNAGFNIYIFKTNLKLQNDISLLDRTDLDDETYRDLRWRSQLQFSF